MSPNPISSSVPFNPNPHLKEVRFISVYREDYSVRSDGLLLLSSTGVSSAAKVGKWMSNEVDGLRIQTFCQETSHFMQYATVTLSHMQCEFVNDIPLCIIPKSQIMNLNVALQEGNVMECTSASATILHDITRSALVFNESSVYVLIFVGSLDQCRVLAQTLCILTNNGYEKEFTNPSKLFSQITIRLDECPSVSF